MAKREHQNNKMVLKVLLACTGMYVSLNDSNVPNVLQPFIIAPAKGSLNSKKVVKKWFRQKERSQQTNKQKLCQRPIFEKQIFKFKKIRDLTNANH